MKNESSISKLIEVLCQGQNIPESVHAQVMHDNEDLPERMMIYYYMDYFLENPNTDWKALLLSVESVLEGTDKEQIEAVYDYVLESLDNLSSYNHFDMTAIESYLGPLSKDYMKKYDAFMASIPADLSSLKSKK